jgi:peptidyl-prolyl cis-trans isomerase C
MSHPTSQPRVLPALFAVVLAAALVALAVWRRGAPPAPGGQPARKDIVATVNGTPIGAAEVKLETRAAANPHPGQPMPQPDKDALEDLIRQELAAQRARELGLDQDPGYQEDLRRVEAQLTSFKRKKLADLFYQKHIVKQAEVTDEEARRYFDEHAAQLRTEVHVHQILSRDEGQIGQTLAELERGVPFEEIADRGQPTLPPGARKPWDTGFLRWQHLPEAWREVVYALEPGQRSGIIRGPNRRFWIVQVVAKREDPNVTFESVKPALVELLEQSKLAAVRAETEKSLRAKAKIEYGPGK